MSFAISKFISSRPFFSYKLTALVTVTASLINIYFWSIGDYYNVFSGYSINPSATMKVITSIGFLILGTIYYVKNKTAIQVLIFLGLLIQCVQFLLINFNIVDPQVWRFSSGVTIALFCFAFLALYFIKVKRVKIVFLTLNGVLYIISAFAVFYYLLDMYELNSFPGFKTLSWNTAMLFFMNAISLFEFKLIRRIDALKMEEVLSQKTHPYNYFPFFFLVPIVLIIITSFLAYYKVLSVVQAAFFIILFLNTSSFINMFFYSYNFIKFYVDVTQKSSQLQATNIKLNTLNSELAKLNKKLKKKNAYLEDFATITSHNLREPIVALSELQKISNHEAVDEDISSQELRAMFNTTIQRLNQGIDSLVRYHEFIKSEDIPHKEKTMLSKSVEETLFSLSPLRPDDTLLEIDIKDDIALTKNYIDTVMENLLVNSFKYKRDHVPLNIKIMGYQVNSTYNILYKDNGIGIHLNYFKKQVFKKRKRFHKKSDNSNGYGLYYTKLCVNKLNGKIEIFSTPGKGTAFRIKLKNDHEKNSAH